MLDEHHCFPTMCCSSDNASSIISLSVLCYAEVFYYTFESDIFVCQDAEKHDR
jgi:hypothetical protein